MRAIVRTFALAIPVGLVACMGDTEPGTKTQASHPEVSLPGSNFEIDTNANLKLDDASPSIDWGSIGPGGAGGAAAGEVRQVDDPSGSSDRSFGNGTKEDTEVPSVVDGGIPPNKSDLLTFGVYLEVVPAGLDGGTAKRFLHMYWHRVQEPSGTTNMDFEFNQSDVLSDNGVTPIRTAGDLLIQYDLSQGGTNPLLFLSRWVASGPKSLCGSANSTPCWGPKVDLTAAGDATGSINTTDIPASEADGLGPISARTFGEASIDFDAIVTDSSVCTGFGSAYLKSRASDSFTAALKDFIPPVAVNISNCGTINITKTDDASPANPLAGAVFTLYNDNAPVGGARGAEDTITSYTCTTSAAGTCSISNVLQGEYWVVETTTPAGYDTAADQHASVTPDATVSLTFVDPRQFGAVLITKVGKDKSCTGAGAPAAYCVAAGLRRLAGATFEVKSGSTVVGTVVTAGTAGQACLDSTNATLPAYLQVKSPATSLTVVETIAPAGWAKDATSQTVSITRKADCTAGSPNAPNAPANAFVNDPLSKITVLFESKAGPGVTQATIQCTGEASPANLPEGTPPTGGKVLDNLIPGTYACTVVVDP